MTSLWQSVSEFYQDFMEHKSDPRVKNWPLMSGPLPTIILCITYVYVVKIIGPKFMEHRRPFQLQRIMIFYNSFQVIFASWLFYKSLKYGWWNNYSFRCQPVDFSRNAKALSVACTCWWFYISKFIEFFDTFFFVLRKKNNHISTLHVLHHGIVPLSTWVGVKFCPGGHSTLVGLLNTFVHIIMYGYYLLAAFGPKMAPYLWWKKYLTTLQMVQFVLLLIHSAQLLFIECDYPRACIWTIIANTCLFFYLFKEFYVQAYIKKQDNRTTVASSINKKRPKTT